MTKATGGICSDCGKILGTSLKYPYQGKILCFDCFQKTQAQLLEAEQKRQELYEYMKQIFNISNIPSDIVSIIDTSLKDGKKIGGIKSTLYYYYEILGSTTPLSSLYFVLRDKYDEARDYFVKQRQINEQNAQAEITTQTVTIKLDPKKIHQEANKKKFKYDIEDL